MRSCVVVFCAIAIMLAGSASAEFPIKHFVVMMLENRAFDHRLGWLHKTLNPEIDGLTGTEQVPLNLSNPSAGSCTVNDNADPYATPDGGHNYDQTRHEVYGAEADTVRPPYPEALMDGFADEEKSCDIMSSIPVDDIPVSQALIENFVLIDRHYSSFPGCTEVNRMFYHSGTSANFCNGPTVDDYIKGFPQETIFHKLAENGVRYKIYMGDDVSTAMAFKDQRTASALGNYHNMDKFYEDCKSGDLPHYSVVEPRFFSLPDIPANDEHPKSHSIYQGELLFKDVYDHLRASPAWNATALFIFYDEHGGLYDHVPPPVRGVPPAEPGQHCEHGKGHKDPYFDFSRLGVRVPAMLISPWVPKGLVQHEPPDAAKPTNSSRYTHSSVLRTVHDLFMPNASFLTQRDAWAATLTTLFSEKEPRTDTPLSMPTPAAETYHHSKMGDEWLQPVNDWQESLLDTYAALHHSVPEATAESLSAMRAQVEKIKRVGNEGDAQQFMSDTMRMYKKHFKLE